MQKTLSIYEEVIGLALKGKWYSFLAFTYELASQHYMRCSLSMLAIPMLTSAIEFNARWGAFGKVEYLKKKYARELALQTFSEKADVAVQTDDVIVGLSTTAIDKTFGIWNNNSSDEATPDSSLKELYNNDSAQITNARNSITPEEESQTPETHEETLFSLDMVDLTSIIKSSQGKRL
jgi:hypothetical protein